MHIAGIPKASVEIRVNGNALHEHQADSEDAKTALSYVEIVEGAEFSIVLTPSPSSRIVRTTCKCVFTLTAAESSPTSCNRPG
jgi:hypothetical protein